MELEPIKVYVQSIIANGEMSETYDHDLLAKNINALKPYFAESGSTSPTIFYAGRFICVLTMSDGKTVQRFYDFNKNRIAAEYASTHYVSNSSLLMEMFDKQFKVYDQEINQVELVLIVDPLEGISAN